MFATSGFPKFNRNRRLVETLASLAAQRGERASQVAIAWVLAKGRNIVPVIGARKQAQLRESLAAAHIQVSPEELVRIENAIPASDVAGGRYAEQQMRMLDSER